ncbi:cytochrome c peroxidase [Bacteroidota bacterium]
MKKTFLLFTILAFLLAACGGSKDKKSGEKSEAQLYKENMELEAEIGDMARGMFQVLPASADNPENPATDAKVKLGKILYFDNRLSKDQTQSCNTCHDLSTYGVDNEPTSDGDDGSIGTRNSPTVLNVALHTTQFWDGRAKDVEEQAGMPITNPVEMNIPSEEFLEKRLSEVEMYQKLFKEAFPEDANPITYDNLEKAIGAFERTLLVPSKWDNYLAGEKNALTLDEKKGLKTFIDAGCVTCHTGSIMGGNMFQKFGVYGNYWDLTKSAVIDSGRYVETKIDADLFMFKVPSLRNITKTGPYFHDGSITSLKETIKIIAKTNLNKDLTDEEIASVAVFLEVLTGEVPADVAAVPEELL